MIIDPTSAGASDIYKLMVGLIVPRPIAFVSTMDTAGSQSRCFQLLYSSQCESASDRVFANGSGQRRKRKDTLHNIEATQEFVVNVVSEDFVAKMNLTSPEYPPEVDEFVVSGLTPLPSDLVRPARVAESRASMECSLVQVVHVSPKPLGGSIVLGEVLRFHVADELFDSYRIDPDLLRAVGRMGGPTYARTTDRFNLERPSFGQ